MSEFMTHFIYAYGSTEMSLVSTLMITLFILLMTTAVAIWGYKKMKGAIKESKNVYRDVISTFIWAAGLISISMGLILTLKGV